MGKHKYIETPERLWEMFVEYREWAEANPIRKHVFIGKEGRSEYEELVRPVSFESFQEYCANKGYIWGLEDYFSNKDGRYSEYTGICSRVKQAIRSQHIENGLVGLYNASITQRLHGLADKTEQKISVEPPLFSDADVPADRQLEDGTDYQIEE